MAKRRGSGGFGGPGMGANPNAMLKQLQKMQEDMVKAQEALAEETLEVQAAGGAITVVITGHQRVKSITIKPELLDTSDPEWVNDLQDLLVVAINQAIEQSQQRAAERMEAVSGGMSGMLSGGLNGLLGG
ncbi:MAG: YbaB/EbfC family nucleoid-associated protein [Candidatus Thermofonsia Clade 1 bacterium]|uniref:Nucleoid-associated protein CUN51_01505 n=1 Tax=Candidatus Thermofonsia Clade 1 bacterium TaxID=2364210 RepID=A0A2M8P456_9CHLR|nr:MAG: YbaB/EbfC family nucleoid-associated protein [Candidatus Thermofonsia Clade 1 bacterium]